MEFLKNFAKAVISLIAIFGSFILVIGIFMAIAAGFDSELRPAFAIAALLTYAALLWAAVVTWCD